AARPHHQGSGAGEDARRRVHLVGQPDDRGASARAGRALLRAQAGEPQGRRADPRPGVPARHDLSDISRMPAPGLLLAPIVAVLYFDNNTGDPAMDALQKGLADMMITDLAAVDGVTVVERSRLQAVVGELALQRGKYFDQQTAVKLGKGVGA